MAWVSYDYICDTCGDQTIQLMDRNDIQERVPCKVCPGQAERRITAQICRVSYPDGVNNRWKHVKERRKLDKALRAAKKSGNVDVIKDINAAKQDVARAAATDRRSGDICKVSTPES